jgi:hypothetical protein
MSDDVSLHNDRASKDVTQEATPVMAGLIAGLMLFVIFLFFYFKPDSADPFGQIMDKMSGPGPAFFAGLGILITLLTPGGWSLRSGLIALVTAGILASGMWISTL